MAVAGATVRARRRAGFALAAAACLTIVGVLPVSAHAATATNAAANAGKGGFSAQVVNGTSTSIGKWPFLVGILQKNQPDTFYAQFCDGTLVTPTLVLSAAHCTFDESGLPLDPSAVDILVGADDLSTSAAHEGTRIPVTAIIRNPGYNADTLLNDMALFQLASPASATPVEIVPPSSDYRWAGGKPATVAGFGCSRYDIDSGQCVFPTHLREAGLPMLSDSHCAGLGGVYARVFNPETMVCAGSIGTVRQTSPGVDEGTAKSPCFGDSGGPLVVDGPTHPLQVGVVSWGPSACGTGPGVFTRLGGKTVRAWLRANGVPIARSAFSAGPPIRIDGTFTPVVGDFNGDGFDDLLLYGPGSARDVLERGTATGFVHGGPVNMGGALVPVAGDFNGDGKTDILWFGPGPARDVMWLGTSTGFVRGPAVNIDRYSVPVAGDFNGDGTDDVFWYGPGTRSDLLTYGSAGGFTAGPSVTNRGRYTPVVGDFDGDGKTDILWYGVGAQPDTLWRGAGSGFTSGGTLRIAGTFTPVAGDFDGDHRADVLWYSATGPDVLRRGSASGFTGAPEVTVRGSYLPIAGDFNGDGRADIIWYAPGRGAEMHWLGAHR